MSVRKDLDSVIQSASLALGYPQLRSKQYDAVKSFLEGNDVFVVLPTGSGKSLCYSLLPLAFNTLLGRESSIVIVISLLKALMKDQVASLSSKDLVAAYVDADTLPDKEKIKRVHSGQFSLLFISPELLLLNLAFREIEAFRDSAAPLRIVVATVAFGMGVNCCSENQVIHWGPATDMEGYLQECGRAGRNGEFAAHYCM
eukprot:Em0002g1399a